MLMVYTDGICYMANNLSHGHSSPSTLSIPPVLFITVFPIFFSLHLRQLYYKKIFYYRNNSTKPLSTWNYEHNPIHKTSVFFIKC
jgi:hypothetical protein